MPNTNKKHKHKWQFVEKSENYKSTITYEFVCHCGKIKYLDSYYMSEYKEKKGQPMNTNKKRYWDINKWKNSKNIIDRTIYYINSLSPHNLWKADEVVRDLIDEEINRRKRLKMEVIKLDNK